MLKNNIVNVWKLITWNCPKNPKASSNFLQKSGLTILLKILSKNDSQPSDLDTTVCITYSPELRHLHVCIEKNISNYSGLQTFNSSVHTLILFRPNALQTCIFGQNYMREKLLYIFFFFQNLPLVLPTNKKDFIF